MPRVSRSSSFVLRVSHFSFRPHSRLAFPVRPHLCFAFPISHSALIRASRFPFVLIRASRFPFLIPPSFAPRVSRSSSFVLRVSHFSFRPHSRPEFLASPSALIRLSNFSPPRPPSFVPRISCVPNFLLPHFSARVRARVREYHCACAILPTCCDGDGATVYRDRVGG